MDPTKHTEIRPQRRACPLAGVAMHFANAVSIVIACLLACAVTDGPMRGMTPRIAGGLIGIQHRAADRNVLIDQLVARPLIRVVADRVPSG
jgi:hypothetical protein